MPTPVLTPLPDNPDLGGRLGPERGRGTPGALGAVLAGLTAVAAVTLGLAATFSTPLLAAALLTLCWPLVFSAQFTTWVFGSAALPFWKPLLGFLAAGLVVKFHTWSTSGELWRKR